MAQSKEPRAYRQGARYDGHERRQYVDYVTQQDFEAFVRKMDTALFAQNSENDNGQPGLMVTARRMDAHINAVCTIAKLVRWAFYTAGATLAAGAAGAKILDFVITRLT